MNLVARGRKRDALAKRLRGMLQPERLQVELAAVRRFSVDAIREPLLEIDGI